MGELLVTGMDIRIANDLTFFPNADPTKHHAKATAICNGGFSKSGKEIRDEVPLDFWGKLAGIACFYTFKGKQINVRGNLQSYVVDSGRVTPGGKKELIRTHSINVRVLHLLGDPMKEVEKTFAGNLIRLLAAGVDPRSFTAQELLRSDKQKLADFNPVLANQTGYYGRAPVYTNDRKFWKDSLGLNPNVPDAAATAMGINVNTTDPAEIQKSMLILQTMLNNAKAAEVVTTDEDPAVIAAANAAALATANAAAVAAGAGTAKPDPFPFHP